MNVEETAQSRLRRLYKAKSAQKGIRYLGIKISAGPHDLLVDNISAYQNKLDGLLKGWWWGRSTILKMKILPVLIFLFQNLIIPIPMKCIEEIQCLLNKFIWQGRKARVKMSWLQQRLMAMKRWWKEQACLVWDIEQYEIPLPLRKWVLTDPVLRVSGVQSISIVYKAIMGVWTEHQRILSPVQSPLASFLYHPKFKKLRALSSFQKWEGLVLDKLGKVSSERYNYEGANYKGIG